MKTLTIAGSVIAVLLLIIVFTGLNFSGMAGSAHSAAQVMQSQMQTAKKQIDHTVQAAGSSFVTNRPVPSINRSAGSYDRQLRELKQLLDDGIINEDEFEQKKKHILGL